MLILIAGLPGTGKTTIAKAFAKKYGAVHFNSDHLRRELGLWGSYRSEDKTRVYEELFARTKEALGTGKTVVVDSTFYRAELRKNFAELAENQGVKLKWILAIAPNETLLQRVTAPRPDSEANEAVLKKIEAEFEPLEQPHFTVDTSKSSPEAIADAIHNYIGHG
ncbi:MAG: AAA family ATPase [Saprospiraceae bacterium]|nr:AAA family ATPase [Saprospiraceae bacterium]MCF8249590.1 AAA family ATPase [Saprospiraceae bacterium]MCF8280490.1 AAA family ATPase [Bacteroidales bacterium]MCF8310422.1 AAA family ATPase [Saprospiraceae bacterium]MCF8439800.1 AAA family ATPase [Saprospiraceae bacterium]